MCTSDKETKISDNVTKVGYSYNNHAYIVTRKGYEGSNRFQNIR